MINTIYRLLLTFNATSLLVIIFLAQKKYTLGYFYPQYPFLAELPNFVSYLGYFLVPVLLTGFSISLSSLLGQDDFKPQEISSIEHANNSFLPSYLGYFFVALSVGNWETLWFVYGVLFLFTFLSQALYFNPLFLLFGFEFYNVTTKNGTAIFLISKNKYKRPCEVDVHMASRINNYTFIERGTNE